MTESKEEAIFEKTREILAKYELTGISKNELAQQIQHYGVASRMTFYVHFDEMTNPKGANIIRVVVPKGKINALCFPTASNQALVKLKEKFKSVNDLLDLIEKYPDLGDCFIPIPDIKNIFKKGGEIPPDSGEENSSGMYFETIHSKKTTFGDFNSIVTLRFHNARHDLLKELPLFLTWYLNLPKMKYSKQVKEESIKILTPIFLRSLKILHNDYSKSINMSKQANQRIQNVLPRDSAVFVRLIKSITMPHTEVEFLNILGRYYYTISKQFSKDMKYDTSKEQKLISNILVSFYRLDDSDNLDSELDSNDIQKIISLSNDYSTLRDKEDKLKTEYGFEKNSATIRLGLYNTDALHIKIYYIELFLMLGLFNKKEHKFLNYILNQEKEKFKTLTPIDLKKGRGILRMVNPEF